MARAMARPPRPLTWAAMAHPGPARARRKTMANKSGRACRVGRVFEAHREGVSMAGAPVGLEDSTHPTRFPFIRHGIPVGLANSTHPTRIPFIRPEPD